MSFELLKEVEVVGELLLESGKKLVSGLPDNADDELVDVVLVLELPEELGS